MKIEIRLTAGQLSRLNDLVTDKQDALYDKLTAATAEGKSDRAAGLRETLKFWDEIQREVSSVANRAWESEHHDERHATNGEVDDSDVVSLAYQEDPRDPMGLGGI
jgi:hypothetical protein